LRRPLRSSEKFVTISSLKLIQVRSHIANYSVRINGEIRASQLRIIGASGEQLGIMSRNDALDAARDAGLDLVEISPNAEPPVARIVDWGKYQYQKMKEQQRNKKSSRSSEIKQMRLGLKIGQNDLDIKLRKIRKFLDDGDKVKIQVVFRGREMAHPEIGRLVLDKILESLSDVAIADQKAIMAGRNLSIMIRSNPNAKVENA
jgi:translation initiation factor IF-3